MIIIAAMPYLIISLKIRKQTLGRNDITNSFPVFSLDADL